MEGHRAGGGIAGDRLLRFEDRFLRPELPLVLTDQLESFENVSAHKRPFDRQPLRIGPLLSKDVSRAD